MPAVVRGGRKQASRPQARRAPARGRQAAPAGPALLGRGFLSPGTVWAGAAALGALVVVVVAAGGWGASIGASIGQGVDARLADMGFRLERVDIHGATPAGQRAILNRLRLQRGQPIVGLNLDRVREDVEAVGWVSEARVVRLLPDRLVIEVSERRPMAVWQSAGAVSVVDGQGAVIPGADPGRFATLPLVVGSGAGAAAAELVPMLDSFPRLRDRLEAAVRVDDRRWNLLLRDGGVIQLPADDVDAAFVQLEAMDQRQRLLDLGFARVDMRVPGEVAVQPRGSV